MNTSLQVVTPTTYPTPHPSKPTRTPASARPRLFGQTRPFEELGTWTDQVTVARPGTLWRLAEWIALHRRPGAARGDTWTACQAANPSCFKTYAVISLAGPSFFLPAGEVVFDAAENPTQIPEAPPQGVMLRHLEAMDAHPEATFYYLEPVFTSEPAMRLYPPAELRAEAAGDMADTFMLAGNYGWLFRAADRSRRLARRAGAWGEARLQELLDRVHPTTRRLGELEREYYQALRNERLEDAVRLRSSMRVVEWHLKYDPILCFELPTAPGRLRFEAHWYVGTDGRTYVHY